MDLDKLKTINALKHEIELLTKFIQYTDSENIRELSVQILYIKNMNEGASQKYGEKVDRSCIPGSIRDEYIGAMMETMHKNTALAKNKLNSLIIQFENI